MLRRRRFQFGVRRSSPLWHSSFPKVPKRRRPPHSKLKSSLARRADNRELTMPEFSYVAMERTGIKKQGSLTAGNEREAMAMLDARGLFPVNITAARSASKGSFGWSRKVKSRYTAAFYAQ